MKIISHRGNGNVYKENTKEALLKAINTSYIDGIELDVRMTKDNIIIITHDVIINFASDGSGIVSRMDYKELLEYNFGTVNNPSKICTLEELLKSINNNKIILIEIKSQVYDLVLIDETYKIIKKYNYLNIYIISFNYEILVNFRKKYCKTGLLIGNYINIDKFYNNFDINVVTYNYRNRVGEKETFLWTINKYKEDIEKFNIITDKPYLFK